MTYEIAKAAQTALLAQMAAPAAILRAAPQGPMGLTLESAKTPEWKAAYQLYWSINAALTRFNRDVMNRHFKAEWRADQAAEVAAMRAAQRKAA